MSKPVQAITPAALAQLEECIDPWPAPEVIDDGLSAVEEEGVGRYVGGSHNQKGEVRSSECGIGGEHL